LLLPVALFGTGLGFAGVSRAIQDEYRRSYANKALFLKIPVYAEKQYLFVAGRALRSELYSPTATPRFKVGDQVRVLNVDFGGDEIRFKVSSISSPTLAELVFKFQTDLQDSFPNRDDFDAALAATFTEGLRFSDLDEAKKHYVDGQFESVVRDLAAITSTSREFVLKQMAPRLPAYQDALRDVENLKNRNQDLASQAAQAQAENRRLETDLRQQQAETARLRTLNSSLQEKIDSSTSQLSRLGDDLRSAKGLTQSYQSQITNLQRSLNLKIDEGRDLAAQISDLGQAMRKLQRENDVLEKEVTGLRANVEEQKASNKRLSGEIEDLTHRNSQMKETIDALTSKEDSLARQYLQMKQSKEKLESITRSIDSLTTRIAEQRSEGGISARKILVSMGNIPLGHFEWKVPEAIGMDEHKTGELQFTAESIDYVRVSPEERQVLHSLGDRLRVGVKLLANDSSLVIAPDKALQTQEVGERDKAVWRWQLTNRGTQDVRLQLAVHLINRNNDEIPVLKEDSLVASTNMVRQVRNYLQPIPLAVGAVVGFLAFGVVSIFRRQRKPGFVGRQAGAKSSESSSYLGQKQL